MSSAFPELETTNGLRRIGAGRQFVRNSASAEYDAASQTRRTLGWNAPTTSPNGLLGNLTTLRDRSRAATRNNGFGKGISDKLVTNIIGTGIKPLSMADDAEFRKEVQALFLKWTDESDADGLLDFYGQQAQVARCWHDAGETMVRIRQRDEADGLSVPLQLQVIEPELCPHNFTQSRPNGNKVRAGIERNAIGKRTAYWFHPSRPSEYEDFDPFSLVSVPADAVCHVFLPLRAGQLRGLPHLTPVLIKLHELNKFDDATLLRQQLANLFVAFVTKPADDIDADPTDPLGMGAARGTESNDPLRFEAGIFQEMDPGEDVKFSDPPDAGAGYSDFMKLQLRAVCAAIGVPYELLSGDMSAVNDRSVRVILSEFRRFVSMIQHQIIVQQFCRKVWNAWIERAVLAGKLPVSMAAFRANPDAYARVKWMPQGWPYIQPVQDIEAKKDAIRAGFSTRSAEVSEQGEDAESIDAQQAADNKRADDLGLKYDSDGRHAENTTRNETGVIETDEGGTNPTRGRESK